MLTGILGVSLLVCAAVLLPPVQRFAIGKASEIVEAKTGMRISVDRFRLGIPPGVSVEGAAVVTPAGDTLAAVGRLGADVALWPLLGGEVRLSGISLRDARATWRDTLSSMLLVARLDELDVGGASLGLKTNSVKISHVELRGADVALETGGGGGAPRPVETDTVAAAPWRVDVRRVELSDVDFTMRSPSAPSTLPSTAPFDPADIGISGLELLAKDIHYYDTDISASLRRLEFSERSGLAVRRGEGDFAMTGEGVSLTGFELATDGSTIRADALTGGGLMRAEPSTPVSLRLATSISPEDVYRFVAVDAAAKRALKGQTLSIEATLDGTLGDISINTLAAEMPGHVTLNAGGRIRSVLVPADMSGEVSLAGELRNLDFAREFIADTALRRRVGFPRRMTLKTDAVFSPGVYALPRFSLTAGRGRLDAEARMDTRSGKFDAGVSLDRFPLHAFLPHDSLGAATLSLAAHGTGLDPFDGMDAEAGVEVEHLDYRGFDWHGVSLRSALAGGELTGRLLSSNEALSLDLALDGALARDDYHAALRGSVWRADIRRMGFAVDTLSFTTYLDAEATGRRDVAGMQLNLTADIDSTVVRFGEAAQRIPLTTIRASAADTLTSAQIRSGDLAVDFSSPLSVDSLAAGFGRTAAEIQRQLAALNLAADSLQMAIPDVNLRLRAGPGNFLHDFAALENIDFAALSADVSVAAGKQFHAGARVDGLAASGLTLDTLRASVRRRGDKLVYSLRLVDAPGGGGEPPLIWAWGVAGGDAATLNVYQRNAADSVGFDFGLEARLTKNSLRVSMPSPNPVFGYERWVAGEGNYVEYARGGQLAADFGLQGPHGNHFRFSSASLPGIGQGALRLDAAGIHIGHAMELFPTAPPVGGVLSSDVTFGFHDGVIAARGVLGVDDFAYGGRRVADVAATVDFASDGTGRMLLDAGIDLDKNPALTAKGYYTQWDMNFAVALSDIPLSLAEAFLPPGTARLSGHMDGRVDITGNPSAPAITGEGGFTGGKIEAEMTGTTYGLSTDRITVAGGRLLLNGLGIVAPNKQKLAASGAIDISDPGNMKADIAVTARNFEAVNSTHLGGSQLYGKAAFDVGVTVKGPLDALVVRGDVDLLRSTDIVYILRESSQGVRDEKQDLVEFAVFADSLYVRSAADTLVQTRRDGGVDVLLDVKIEEGLKATLSLDELSENRVELIGGGDLAFSMNNRGDTRLSGRYTLSGGTVYYKPPMISQKIFSVDDGSYVEWTGAAAEPAFNVTGSLTQRVALESGGGGDEKEVDFRIIIAVAGSLKSIAVTFDVAAPADLEIQNELAAMSDEERMQQALTLLVYNQYTGLAYSSAGGGGFDARDQMGKFISKEINQWARNNLKGVDFSMGIDSRSDAAGGSYTDYSYSVSKSLFSDRVKVSIGGSVSDNATSAQSLSENLIDDISLEYRLNKRDNMFLKVYRNNTQESILEGEVTETGAGFVVRKKINGLGDIFRRNKRKGRVMSEE